MSPLFRTLTAILLLLPLLAFAPAGAEIYRWTDAHGKTHYTDHKPAEDAAQSVESFEGDAKVSFIDGGPVGDAKTEVRMFTTAWCSVCKRAKAYFKQRGTPFRELDIEASPSAKLEFERLGGHGVPVILVGKQRMDGFDARRMENLLAEAGL
jgi:glutaredoxin